MLKGSQRLKSRAIHLKSMFSIYPERAPTLASLCLYNKGRNQQPLREFKISPDFFSFPRRTADAQNKEY